MLLKELLKVYMHTLLECDCNGDFHKLTNCVSNVYMACLYYSTGQYRTALEYCVTVITSEQSGNNVNYIETVVTTV